MITSNFQRSLLFLLILAAPPGVAYAHVKWFSEFDFADQPRQLAEVTTPLFWGLAVLTMVAVAGLVIIDQWVQEQAWWKQVSAWLAERRTQSNVGMRIAVGATLLLAWQVDSMLVPELRVPETWIGWLQFVIALLLIFQQTVPLAGILLGGIYLYGIWRFDYLFYMLDYVHYVGIALYLALSNVENIRVRAIRLPLLYLTVGFSLAWLGIEKLVYPSWALHLLTENPQLMLGLPSDFFLYGAAFVEIALGYLLIIRLFERPLALMITLVLFTTTLVFGKIEIIGHTTVHAALIVFLLHGPGTVYQAPITFYKHLPLRIAFAVISFALLLAILLPLYVEGAWDQFRLHGG